MTPTKVALFKTSDRIQGVQKVLQLLEFPSMQGKRVVLKPNFNTEDPPPASTHNDTLRQLILEIQNRGASSITLAERSNHVFDEVIRQKGIDVMASELGFAIKNLDTDDYTIFNRDDLHWGNGFRLPRTVSDAEYIVSTCCLKTHFVGVITMSLKLSVGILPYLHMNELHRSARMNSMIAEINLSYQPQLIVMDGVKTFISGGPSSGTLADGNVMLAGTDRIAIDAVGSAILKDLGSTAVGGKIFNIEQIKRATQLNLGIRQADQIQFVTDDEPSHLYAERLTAILANG
ncbi:MAG: hypothetical protein A2Y94_10880 [Caldithrix sp. RBG_13_44_9]|nr:MAG: hypothetical protein A2Y94_10880 [Caldithrix sp. RBG_13_44_9]